MLTECYNILGTKNGPGVSRLSETQQFFKCKNSAILCKVDAKMCKKSHFWSSLNFNFQITSNRYDLVLLGKYEVHPLKRTIVVGN